MGRIKHVDRVVHALLQNTSLPAELCDEIALYVEHGDLLRLGVVSRQVCYLVTAAVYREVQLDLYTPRFLNPRLSKFVRSVMTNARAADSVQRLSLTGQPHMDWRWEVLDAPSGTKYQEYRLLGHDPPEQELDVGGWRRGETDVYLERERRLGPMTESFRTRGGGIAMQSALIQLLRRLTKLEHLSVTSDVFRFRGFPEAFSAISKEGAFAQLQDASLAMDLYHNWTGRSHEACYRGKMAVMAWDKAMVMPLEAPNVRSATIIMAAAQDLSLRARNFALTKLVLFHCVASQESKLDTLLEALPCLQHFVYEAMYEDEWHRGCCRRLNDRERELGTRRLQEIHPLATALARVSPALETLRICEGFSGDASDFRFYLPSVHQPLFEVIEVRALEQVRSLSMPFPALIGWFSTDMSTYDWDQLLPTKLQELALDSSPLEHLHPEADHYGTHWTHETLAVVFESLMDWIAARSPQTKLSLRLHLARDTSSDADPLDVYVRKAIERDISYDFQVHGKWARRDK